MVAPGGFSGTYTSFVKLLRVNNLVQGSDERFDLSISLHTAEAAFGIQQSGDAQGALNGVGRGHGHSQQ
jgi:hypothetical protein